MPQPLGLVRRFRLIDLKCMISSACSEAIPRRALSARRGAVTRLTDLPPDQAKRLAELECPDFKTRPWVSGPALSAAPGRDCFFGRACRARREPVSRPRSRLSRDPVDRCCRRSVVQPHLDQFRSHRLPGGLERRLPARPAARAGAEGQSARSPRCIIRSWARPTRSRWSLMRANWPAG